MPNSNNHSQPIVSIDNNTSTPADSGTYTITSTSTSAFFGINSQLYENYLNTNVFISPSHYQSLNNFYDVPELSEEEKERQKCDQILRTLNYIKFSITNITEESIFTLPEATYISLLKHCNKHYNSTIDENAPEFEYSGIKIRNVSKYHAIDWDKYIEST